MARITDLAPDTLLCIVDLVRNDQAIKFHGFTRLKELSLISKDFNAACAPFIFRSHTLVLRRTKMDGWRRNWIKWDNSYLRERLELLTKHGGHMRELTIVDAKTGNVDAFPDASMGDLLRALKTLDGLTGLTLEMKDCERQMPVVMWTWIRDQGSQLKNLVLKGSWSIPLEAMALWPITTIHTLTLDPFDYQTESFLSLIKAPNLILRDTRGHSSPLLSYHPSADDDHLQDIQIFVQRRFYDDRKIDHLYDFTQVPSANITVTLEGDSRYDDNYLETWKTVRTAVRKVFVDDLTQFDVSRQGHNRTAAVVQWKNEQGWKPQNQVHLQGEETDDAEQRQINHVKFYDDILRRARVRYRD